MSIIFSTLLIQFYNRQKRKKEQAKLHQQILLEQQRSRLTADLHDDIGSALSSLQINSAIAAQLIEKNPEQAGDVIKKVEKQSRKLSERIGDFIWSIKPGKDEFMTLSSRIRTYASDILNATNIYYQIEIDKNADSTITDFTARKNTLLIIKEAVNNAVKYSDATEINISLRLKENHIHIGITDNGKGFDYRVENAGNGLGNMKKRVEEMNGEFLIDSTPQKGTTVSAIIPLP
jgi:signal transduction histidine kinase